jgi:transposase InsO family protein
VALGYFSANGRERRWFFNGIQICHLEPRRRALLVIPNRFSALYLSFRAASAARNLLLLVIPNRFSGEESAFQANWTSQIARQIPPSGRNDKLRLKH